MAPLNSCVVAIRSAFAGRQICRWYPLLQIDYTTIRCALVLGNGHTPAVESHHPQVPSRTTTSQFKQKTTSVFSWPATSNGFGTAQAFTSTSTIQEVNWLGSTLHLVGVVDISIQRTPLHMASYIRVDGPVVVGLGYVSGPSSGLPQVYPLWTCRTSVHGLYLIHFPDDSWPMPQHL